MKAKDVLELTGISRRQLTRLVKNGSIILKKGTNFQAKVQRSETFA